MPRCLILEQIAVWEFNELCTRFGMPTEPIAGNGENRFYGRILTGNANAPSQHDYFKFAHANLRELLAYLTAEGREVTCVHPSGYWELSKSAYRTRHDAENYIAEIVSISDINRLLIRVTDKKNAQREKHIKLGRIDTFVFNKVAGVWNLLSVNIPWRNYGAYRFLDPTGSTFITYREWDRAKAIRV